jgi:hypothetical protein
MEKVLENLDGKVTEVGSSIHEVFIMMKMLETQVGQLAERPMGSKGRLFVQFQGPEKVKATQTYSREMEDHTKETMKITTERTKFEIHERRCCIRQDQRTKLACEDQKYD